MYDAKVASPAETCSSRLGRGQALRTSAAGIGAAMVLLGAGPMPAAALATLGSATSAVDPLAPLLATIALLAWALVLWLAFVGAGTLASRLPGHVGRGAAALTRRAAPAGVRRLVGLALGVTVGVGVVGAAPASAGTHLPPGPPAATASFDWPTPPVPDLDWNPAIPRPGASELAAPTPASSTPAVPTPAAPGTGTGGVVVQPGDTLWSIAAAHLPAAASPRPDRGGLAESGGPPTGPQSARTPT